MQAYVKLQYQHDEQPYARVDNVDPGEGADAAVSPGIHGHLHRIEAQQFTGGGQRAAVCARQGDVLIDANRVGPTEFRKRAKGLRIRHRRHAVVKLEIDDIAVEGVHDERVTDGTEAVQAQRDRRREVTVLEHVGFELEHQQQNDPRESVDRRCIRFDDVGQTDAVRKLQPSRSEFLVEEPVNVHRQ